MLTTVQVKQREKNVREKSRCSRGSSNSNRGVGGEIIEVYLFYYYGGISICFEHRHISYSYRKLRFLNSQHRRRQIPANSPPKLFIAHRKFGFWSACESLKLVTLGGLNPIRLKPTQSGRSLSKHFQLFTSSLSLSFPSCSRISRIISYHPYLSLASWQFG